MLTRASSTMTCDAERFTVTSTIDAFHDGVRVHARTLHASVSPGRRLMTVGAAPTQAAGRPTIPWSWYSDPAILAAEMERIFRCSWQYAGHLGELQGPGSYFASDTGPVPIVITIDGDGALRGFVNVCRHRGAIVATGAAKRGTIQCPYHAWTYGLDGCLRAAPRGGDDPGFDADRMGLLPVSVGHLGAVRVRQSGSARRAAVGRPR